MVKYIVTLGSVTCNSFKLESEQRSLEQRFKKQGSKDLNDETLTKLIALSYFNVPLGVIHIQNN